MKTRTEEQIESGIEMQLKLEESFIPSNKPILENITHLYDKLSLGYVVEQLTRIENDFFKRSTGVC